MLELLGFLLPPFIDIINRRIKSSDLRLIVSVVFCSVVGLVVHGWGHQWDYRDQDAVARSVLAIFGAAQFTFKAFYDESELRNKFIG